MNIMEAVETRRSIRKYSSKPIEKFKLDKVASAFRLAPSARNAQNWKLFIVLDEDKRAAIRKAAPGASEFLEQAPAILVACGMVQNTMTNGQRVDSVDLSIGASFCVLEAWEQGLGTCWMGHYHEQGVKEALGLPDSMSVVMISPLGYPAEAPPARPRKPIGEVVEFI